MEGGEGGGGRGNGEAHTDAYLRFRRGVAPLVKGVQLLVVVVVVPGVLPCAVVVLSGRGQGKAHHRRPKILLQFSRLHPHTNAAATQAQGRARGRAYRHGRGGGGGAGCAARCRPHMKHKSKQKASSQASRSPPFG